MKKILFVLIILASFLGFSENFEKYYREFITNNNFKTYITNERTFVYDTDEPYDSRKLEKMPVRIVLHVLPVEDGKYVIAYSYIFIDEKYIDSKGYPLFDKINDYTEDADIRDYGFSPKIDTKHLNLMANYEIMGTGEMEKLLKSSNAKEYDLFKDKKLLKYLRYFDRYLGYEGEDWWPSY
ncbi:hypothetical protein [Leptotrichia sp. oral taxon 212]|jgi:hypothetical protein|uniref:hypothetical protein n=1 Tax=Leptotrichia sp. oral taxon 212 TaxID=712357 RepID=UPI0006A9D129|nr:hypothetical protein [Leptotrichia sp. oral taxon 212]ALA95374.1 hypothetical protein AMK43_04430 [Leptotrichia sp. oral taxon 212]